MNELFWKLLAKLVTGQTWLMHWIVRRSMNKPYFHLDGYMMRWWITPKWLLTKDRHGNSMPYNWLPAILKVRLHYIMRPDADRHLHDHPADNRSIVLLGGYTETDVFGNKHTRVAGDTVLRRAECFHAISQVHPSQMHFAIPEGSWTWPGGVWTMWFFGEWRNDWGFLVNGKKVGFREYLSDEYKAEQGMLLTDREILHCQNSPAVLRDVADYHAVQDTMWDASGDETYNSVNVHSVRLKQLVAKADKIESEY